MLANAMYDLPIVEISGHRPGAPATGSGEIVATAGLVALVFVLARTGRGALSAAAVGAYIGAAYWFTSSTSFANPAVTIGRVFSDTFAGIAPASVPLSSGPRSRRRARSDLSLALYPASSAPAETRRRDKSVHRSAIQESPE